MSRVYAHIGVIMNARVFLQAQSCPQVYAHMRDIMPTHLYLHMRNHALILPQAYIKVIVITSACVCVCACVLMLNRA
jgi:hypothetical protein